MSVERIGGATLYLADCEEVFRNLPEIVVDAIISDPPYGDTETHRSHLSTTILRNGEPAGQALGFAGWSAEDCVRHVRRWTEIAAGWVVFTCEWKYMHLLHADGTLVRFGIWRKPDGAPQFTGDRPGMGWEAVAICHGRGRARGGSNRKTWNGGGKHAFWEVPKGSSTSRHPTAKPVRLYESFVADFTQPDDLVLDPYMGAGTTGVACVNLGRRFMGIEINPRHFDIACERIRMAHAQGRLFA